MNTIGEMLFIVINMIMFGSIAALSCCVFATCVFGIMHLYKKVFK